ncbi:hypothetical protein [Variovorax rhizosphaerae]|uniref:Uncharacterized protein n=1 Tax=Variovorax rhizosphaerae TaxID=1836200 RepID=A0ABU8WYU9_9BURK
MNIELGAEGKLVMSSPQQRWHAGNAGDEALMQVLRFAGQEMMALTDDKGGFTLAFLGFQAKGFSSMGAAKSSASAFARQVLSRMSDLVADRTEKIRMKTPAQLASSSLDSEKDHKTRAATLRRVAGGVRSHAQASAVAGFSDAERKLLAKAAALLESAATASLKAAAIAKRRGDDRATRQKETLKAMQGTFASLTTVANQVALIAAVRSYSLRHLERHDPSNSQGGLPALFREALVDLSETLSTNDDDRAVAQVVTDAWGKFKSGKEALQARHSAVIASLAGGVEAATLASKLINQARGQ